MDCARHLHYKKQSQYLCKKQHFQGKNDSITRNYMKVEEV